MDRSGQKQEDSEDVIAAIQAEEEGGLAGGHLSGW